MTIRITAPSQMRISERSRALSRAGVRRSVPFVANPSVVIAHLSNANGWISGSPSREQQSRPARRQSAARHPVAQRQPSLAIPQAGFDRLRL
ncbi:hypothetical protein [Kaistia sp. 32K]|uniref:hypothetical protein n=1 Tax=Kaistia sp. 32K TaxID=2795690 RepID=UPI001AEED416|nr:hypothetical protein [Kaistia sp. 32K]